jgi:hemolysin III
MIKFSKYNLKKFFTGKAYSEKEEIVHTLTHWIGTMLVCLGSGSLITLAALSADAAKIVSVSIYCASMIILYCASTLYHYARNEKAKSKLKVFDHSAIYLLIAGTYTPFLLINLKGRIGLTMFIIIWAIALLGITAKVFFANKIKRVSLYVYVGMGWLIIFAIKPFIQNMSLAGLIFLALGGVWYTTGVYFYIRKDKEYYHGVWHVFVLLGTIMHFFAVLYGCVAPIVINVSPAL